MYYSDGDKYEGDWKNGNMEGKGTYCYNNGDKYDGDWKNDKKEGKGIMCYSNGDKYEGDWKNDNMEGKGTYCCNNGDKYEGDWKNGEMEVKGEEVKQVVKENIKQQSNFERQDGAEINNNNDKVINTNSLNKKKNNILSLNN